MAMPFSNDDDWDMAYREELQSDVKEPARPKTDCVVPDSDWTNEYTKEIELSQKESEEIEEACGLSPLSESDSESSSGGRPKITSWWAQGLYEAVKTLGMEWVDQQHLIHIASACAGCSAESAVLEAHCTDFIYHPSV